MTDETLPTLPSGSIDFNALHDDLASGTAPADALAKLAPENVTVDDGSAADEPQGAEFVQHNGGGWYHVRAPWMTEPENVQGQEAALARAAEIAAEGDPSGETIF